MSAYSYSTGVGKVAFGVCCFCLGEGTQAPTKYGEPAKFTCGHRSERLFLILLVHQQMVKHLVIVDPTTEKLHWGKQSLREMQNG